jgi:hypothetical protein
MARDPKLLDLSGLTQRELLSVLDQGTGYHGDEMIAALETAQGIERLTEEEAEYRASHLWFLQTEKGKHALNEFFGDYGERPFTLNDLATWAIEKTLRLKGIDVENIELNETDAAVREALQAHLDVLVQGAVVDHLGEGVYRLVPKS